jgi:hypothetical protein
MFPPLFLLCVILSWDKRPGLKLINRCAPKPLPRPIWRPSSLLSSRYLDSFLGGGIKRTERYIIHVFVLRRRCRFIFLPFAATFPISLLSLGFQTDILYSLLICLYTRVSRPPWCHRAFIWTKSVAQNPPWEAGGRLGSEETFCTELYSEAVSFSLHPHIPVHCFNIILSSAPTYLRWSLALEINNPNLICAFVSPYLWFYFK